MNEAPDLLPCPFCGGQASLCTRKTPYPWIAKCDRCGATAGGSAFQNDQWNAHCWNTRTDHCATLIAEAVAAEREVCAKIVYQDAAFRGAYGKAVAGRIRAGTPADAQAALEARDKRVRDEALREASIFDLIEEMKRRHNPPHTGLEKVDLSPTDDSKGP